MKTKTKNILAEHLQSIDPVQAEPHDRPLRDSHADELLRAILTSERPVPERRYVDELDRSSRRSLARRVIAPAVAAGAVALALALGLTGDVGGGSTASAALDRAAETASAQPTPVALAYSYLKTRSTSIDTAVARGRSWSVYSSEVREEWIDDSGSGRIRTVTSPSKFVGPGDRAAWKAAGSPASGFGGNVEDRPVSPGGSPGDPSYEDVATLPTDPEALALQLGNEASAGSSSVPASARTLELIAAALRNPTATPDLRAALYEAAKAISGIEYLGEARDTLGRRGLAVGITSAYSGGRTRHSLVYDPDTSAVLETRSTLLDPVDFADAEPPLVTSATTYIDSGTTGTEN